MPSTIARGTLVLHANDPEKVVDVWVEIVQTKNVPYEFKPNPYGLEDAIIISDEILKQVFIWNQMEYAGMTLHEFLDKINVAPQP